MEERVAGLKAGLANVRNGLRLGRTDVLTRSLKAAAETFDADNAKSAGMALDAVMEFLHDEQLEAPFRFLIDVLDAHQRKGLRTKRLDMALDDARLAATVDALMECEGISLERACRDAARKAGGKLTWKQLKDLRENIRCGKARAEAVEVYKRYLRRDWSPYEDPPAPLSGPKGNRKGTQRP